MPGDARKMDWRIAFWIGALLLPVLLFRLLSGVMLPFVAGLVLGYLLNPVANRLERAGLNRLGATVLILFLFISSLALFVYSGSAQNSWIDSLRQVVVTQKADTNKILTLQHISNYYSFNDPDSGRFPADLFIATIS